jgi:IclR family pca regulon transcriptional regulator
MSVLDGEEIVYVVRVPTRRIMTVAINVGTRFPAYATSMGRVLLAALPPDRLDAYLGQTKLLPLTPKTVTDPAAFRKLLTRVRSQGHSTVDQELEIGLRSMAVPVSGPNGGVIAALNTSMHVSRGSSDAARRSMLPHLQECAAAIAADLAAGPRRAAITGE